MSKDDLQVDVAARLTRAGEVWERGDARAAKALLEEALAAARRDPYQIKFRTRVQLAMMLAGLHLALDDVAAARAFVGEELAFAEHVYGFIRLKGSEAQKRAAAGDFVQLRDLATKVSLLGQSAPEISIGVWLNSGPLSLAGLRGRVVLLEFFATWCRECEALFPRLKRLHEERAGDGLSVIALTRHYLAYGRGEEERAKELDLIRAFAEKHEMSYPVGVSEDEREQELYGATGLPAVVLIDRKGVVRHSYGNGAGEGFEQLLAQCLAEDA